MGLLACLAGVVILAVGAESAERPAASHLLPDNTLAYVRIESAAALRDRFWQTAIGRISSDPQMKPLLGQLYTSLATAYQRIEQRIGLPLDKLLSILQGEVCVAVVPPEQGQPQVVALLEVGERLPDARVLVQRLEEQLIGRGVARNREQVGGTEVTIFQPPGARAQRFSVFEKDAVFVVSSDADLAKQLLAVWNGGANVRTLADNRRFTSIMNRCQRAGGERPHAVWYVDPIELLRRAGRGRLSTEAGLLILESLGLDGLEGFGGSLTMATAEFDMLLDAHLLLKSPKQGVLKMIAMESGDTTPEPWVPHDVARYMTMHWNVQQTYAELSRLYDTIRGESAWENSVLRPISDQLGLDLPRDVVDAAQGRVTLLTWMESPARVNSAARLLAFKLQDAAATRQVLDRTVSRFPDRFSPESLSGVSYYRAVAGQPSRGSDEQTVRRPQPCIGILGEYLAVSDSVALLRQAIMAQADASQSLAEQLDFQLIASKISRQVPGGQAGLVSFSRPEEGLRVLYELANAPQTRTRIREGAANNRALRALNDALNQHPLPPFAVLSQYLAPAGGMLTSDETGLHYTSFTLRREP